MSMEKRKSLAEPAKPALLGGTAIKPPEYHGWEAIQRVIYDKDTGQLFTRTPKSWALIIIFYCIYYICLAAFWYGMLQLFFITLPETEPKYQLEGSIIGINPGVGMRPIQSDMNIDSSMLYLEPKASGETASEDGETDSTIDWAKRYQLYLQRYKNDTGIQQCDDGPVQKKGQDACKFDVTTLGSCNNFPYGYQLESGKQVIEPCVLLKMNRIFGWEPIPYEDKELDDLPDNIRSLVRQNRDKIYVDCEGENPSDREELKGKMTYFPNDQGISFKFLPYNHAHKNYHSPLVAVKFTGLRPGVLHHVACKMWTKGIKHGKKDREGLVHFEVLLDEKKQE